MVTTILKNSKKWFDRPITIEFSIFSCYVPYHCCHYIFESSEIINYGSARFSYESKNICVVYLNVLASSGFPRCPRSTSFSTKELEL